MSEQPRAQEHTSDVALSPAPDPPPYGIFPYPAPVSLGDPLPETTTLYEVRVRRKDPTLPPHILRGYRTDAEAARAHDRLHIEEHGGDGPQHPHLLFFRDRRYEHPVVRRLLEGGFRPAWEEGGPARARPRLEFRPLDPREREGVRRQAEGRGPAPPLADDSLTDALTDTEREALRAATGSVTVLPDAATLPHVRGPLRVPLPPLSASWTVHQMRKAVLSMLREAGGAPEGMTAARLDLGQLPRAEDGAEGGRLAGTALVPSSWRAAPRPLVVSLRSPPSQVVAHVAGEAAVRPRGVYMALAAEAHQREGGATEEPAGAATGPSGRPALPPSYLEAARAYEALLVPVAEGAFVAKGRSPAEGKRPRRAWTAGEVEVLLGYLESLAEVRRADWSAVAGRLEGRSADDCRDKWRHMRTKSASYSEFVRERIQKLTGQGGAGA